MRTTVGRPWNRTRNPGSASVRPCAVTPPAPSRSSTALREELRARDIEANLHEVGCLGLCFAEPLVDILKPGSSRLFFKNVTPDDVPEIVQSYLVDDRVPREKAIGYMGGVPIQDVPDLNTLPGIELQERVALRNAGHIAPGDIRQYIANDGYAALNKALFEMEPPDVIKEISDSGLRGRGGAAFPTGIKWSFLVRSPGPPKYILCNCEEGDPGAYNDKGILESDPHTLIEGMVIAGYATGSSNGIVFIRHGHDGPIDRTEAAIEQAYESGAAGREHPGLRLQLRLGGCAHGRVLRGRRGVCAHGVY